MDTDGLRVRTAAVGDISAVLGLWSSSRSAAADVEDTEHDMQLLLRHDPRVARYFFDF